MKNAAYKQQSFLVRHPGLDESAEKYSAIHIRHDTGRERFVMEKRFICIECPKGCTVEVWIEEGKLTRVKGNECPRGEQYAHAEVENPQRIITSTVQAEGLACRMIPVRTDKPIPKVKLEEAMEAIKKMVIARPVRAGEVLKEKFLQLEANLIATRTVPKEDQASDVNS